MSSNKNVVLIMGKPSTGKSTALMQMKQDDKVYLNADLKELPFKDNFAKNVEIENATDILDFIPAIEAQEGITGGILDTLTYLMSMYERQNVVNASNTMQAWGEYGNFYRNLIHQIKAGTKNYAILAHEADRVNEKDFVQETYVPIKGDAGKKGIEGDFTTILATKVIPIAEAEKWKNDLLTITDIEREDGFKYVFQTRKTKDTIGEKMRSAMGLWDRKELYIDNNLDLVFTRLHEYYGN